VVPDNQHSTDVGFGVRPWACIRRAVSCLSLGAFGAGGQGLLAAESGAFACGRPPHNAEPFVVSQCVG